MTLTVGVIVNPTSGKGKGGKSAPELGRLLHQRGIDAALLVAGSAEEALEMARRAIADGVDAIVAAWWWLLVVTAPSTWRSKPWPEPIPRWL